MRFIRGCLTAASYVPVALGSAEAVTIGDTSFLSAADGDNDNLLLAEWPSSPRPHGREPVFYVTTADGKLILGI
jgi:hypothetical protein